MAAIEQEVVDKILSDIKESHVTSIKLIQQHVHTVERHCEEKIQELSRQNEGLLGAVGKLQAENAKLETFKKVLEEQIGQLRREHEAHITMSQREVEKLYAQLEAENLKEAIKQVKGKKKARK